MNINNIENKNHHINILPTTEDYFLKNAKDYHQQLHEIQKLFKDRMPYLVDQKIINNNLSSNQFSQTFSKDLCEQIEKIIMKSMKNQKAEELKAKIETNKMDFVEKQTNLLQKTFTEFSFIDDEKIEQIDCSVLKQKKYTFNLYDYAVKNNIPASLNKLMFPGHDKPYIPPHQQIYIDNFSHSEINKLNQFQLNLLKVIGGEKIFLENPDGEKIFSMFISNKMFITHLSQILSEVDLVDVFPIVKMVDNIRTEREIRIYKDLNSSEIRALIALGILKKMNKETFAPFYNCLDDKYKKKFNLLKEETFLVLLRPLQCQYSPSTDSASSTAIVCEGIGVWASAYTQLAARLLMHGMDVALFNNRGFESSEGFPTDKKIAQDLETVFAYAKYKNPKLTHKDILLYASSGGLGTASQFASTHDHVDLVIDRSFASFSQLARHMVSDEDSSLSGQIKGKLAQLGVSLFYTSNHAKNVQNMTGNVFIVTDSKDQLVPETESLALKKSVLHSKASTKYYMTTSHGHDGIWLEHFDHLNQFEKFLVESGKSRIQTQLY